MKMHDLAKHETLYFEPEHYDENIQYQNVSVACVEKGFVSTIFFKRYKKTEPSFMHMVFTIEEIDVFIKSLQEARELAINFIEEK